MRPAGVETGTIAKCGGNREEMRRRLTIRPWRTTLSYMNTASVTIRLDPELDRLLTTVSRESGRSRSEIVREALRRQLRIRQFEDFRRKVMPFAEARGYLTDEDVFRDVS